MLEHTYTHRAQLGDSCDFALNRSSNMYSLVPPLLVVFYIILSLRVCRMCRVRCRMRARLRASVCVRVCACVCASERVNVMVYGFYDIRTLYQ